MAAHGITQGELARLLGLEKSTVSRLAAGLEEKGWIQRGRDEGNQRFVRLYLTSDGSAIATRLLAAWQSRQARVIASLTDAERAGLAIGLGGLLRGLVAEGILGSTPGRPSAGWLSAGQRSGGQRTGGQLTGRRPSAGWPTVGRPSAGQLRAGRPGPADPGDT